MDSQIHLIIDHIESFAAGKAFARVGAYERLSGRVEFAVDPQHPAYQQVVDIDLAPRDASGRVTYSTDLCILRPADLATGNRRLIYDVNNRGNKRLLRDFNDAPEATENATNSASSVADAGNGFLMRYGYTVVWSGWQGDLLPGDNRLTMRLPVAAEPGGDLTGLVRTELSVETPNVCYLPLSGNAYTASYATASLDTKTATLTCREHEGDERVPIAADQWQFAHVKPDATVVPSATHCYLASGFKPGWIYELIYTAKDPLVMGLGFVGVRDLVSFLRYADSDAQGTPNPLRQQGVAMEKAYAWGISQSGRFLREFVYRGYNADTQGRRVFDAVAPHVSGGGRVTLNYRFAQPGRYPRQHLDHLYASDQFPFAYAVSTDALTGQTDGILKRPDSDPLVLHTQASAEYWERRGSLVHTDSHGVDVADHERSRVYLFAAAPHVPFPKPDQGVVPYRYRKNPLTTTALLRALLVALDAWATHGTLPPPSQVPKSADGSGVSDEIIRQHFPDIPGVMPPETANQLYVQDFGPDVERGIFTAPLPREDTTREYTLLLPQIDADGHEIAGIRTPDVEVPLATYTGWNLRPEDAAGRDQAGIMGSVFPFCEHAAQALSRGDSHPSLAQRYTSKAHYVRLVAVAAQKQVEQRFLLPEDADRYVQAAMRMTCFDDLDYSGDTPLDGQG
jgi:hypothetical protein